MKAINLKIIPNNLFLEYSNKIKFEISEQFANLKKEELNLKNFNYYISLSSVSSSKIEGEQMEIDSYLKHKAKIAKYQKHITHKIDALYDSYIFAKENKLNFLNVLKAHEIITQNFLDEQERGSIRKTTMIITDDNYKVSFIAANSDIVKQETKKLFIDIETLIKTELNTKQIFYYAAFIHLVFVSIHPFTDGNGRIARLLEKWFLATKLGNIAWFIRSEIFYFKNLTLYYKNLEIIRKNYKNINYSKSIPFLLMLSNSLKKE